MKQNSKRLSSIIISLALVVIALVVFFDFIMPEYANIMQSKGQISAENGIYETESQAVTAVQNVIDQYKQQQGSGEAIALSLPDDQDVAGALAQVYGIAQNNNVAIQSISVSSPMIQAPIGASGGEASSTASPIGSFSLQLSAAGSYENFKNFISGIETNIRIFDVRGVSLSSASQVAPGKNGAGTQDFFNYSITVETYYQAPPAQAVTN